MPCMRFQKPSSILERLMAQLKPQGQFLSYIALACITCFLISLAGIYHKYAMYQIAPWGKFAILRWTAIICGTSLVLSLVASIYKIRHRLRTQPQWTFPYLAKILLAAILYYFISFLVLYSIDGSFTRSGGTTPFCHKHPWNRVYEPLAIIAHKNKWWGGGLGWSPRSVVDFEAFM